MNDAAKQKLLDELLATTTDPIDDLAKETGIKPAPLPPPVHRIADGMPANNTFNMTGPVTIHVYSPAAAEKVSSAVLSPVGPAVVVDVAPKVPALEKIIRFDANYKNREGYDPAFLAPDDASFEVPVPTVDASREGELLRDKKGRILILKYHHFELVMNEERRLQMWSAVNVDYNPELKSSLERKAFGTDKWIPDPRIPADVQIMDPEFYKPAGNIDRGHIVRREDNAWGLSDEEIEFANSDTFHWTNCTPQHEAFNQSAPGKNDPTYIGMKGLWGDFENHVQKNLGGSDTRACILAGPVLDPKDPSKDFGLGAIQYPLSFWKVIAVPTAEDGTQRLTVFGFLLSQRDVVKKFGIEVFRPGRFEKYQVSLTKISEITGVVFNASLHHADVMQGEHDDIRIADGREIRGVRGGAPAKPREPSLDVRGLPGGDPFKSKKKRRELPA